MPAACNFVQDEPCPNEGTHCPPCECTVPWCYHMDRLVCEKHNAWLEGYIEAAYHAPRFSGDIEDQIETYEFTTEITHQFLNERPNE